MTAILAPAMRAVDIIGRKREGESLDEAAIAEFVRGASEGVWPDYQLAALLMAIVWRGMTPAETACLTKAMARSGARLPVIPDCGPRLDKHSTGGVGDKTSFVVAPVVAACGGCVPMISGRGLGHTGGTLDKLESVPGLSTVLDDAASRRVLERVGCCIMSATPSLAPADRRLYALRDVTATVESVPLITASILSKKMTEQLDALVLDVKVGRGAFMRTDVAARELADALVETAALVGLPTDALVTEMEAPLGRGIGNALEVSEAIDVLRGSGPPAVRDLSVALSVPLVVRGGLEPDEDAATRRVVNVLASGEALDRFRLMVEAQGGDPRVVDRPDVFPRAVVSRILTSRARGYVTALPADVFGRAATRLGAGRARVGDPVDPAAGVQLQVDPGDPIDVGEPLATVYGADRTVIEEVLAMLDAAIVVADAPSRDAHGPLVRHRRATPPFLRRHEVS